MAQDLSKFDITEEELFSRVEFDDSDLEKIAFWDFLEIIFRIHDILEVFKY